MADTNDEKKFGHEFLDEVIDWVGDNMTPGEVFTDTVLEYWAETHGWEAKR